MTSTNERVATIAVGASAMVIAITVGFFFGRTSSSPQTSANMGRSTRIDASRMDPPPMRPLASSALPPPGGEPRLPPSPTGTLHVAGTPGALVFEDGHAIGVVPLTKTTSVGPHVVRVARPSLATTTPSVTVIVRPNETSEIAVLLGGIRDFRRPPTNRTLDSGIRADA